MPESTVPNKRRRIAQACSACRTKKSRCDGAQPKCSTCTEMDYECEYMQSGPPSTVMLGREYVVTLERRLQAMESAMSVIKSGDFRDSSPSEIIVATKRQRHLLSDYGNGASQQSSPGGVLVNAKDVQELAWNDDDVTDGMGAVVFAEEEDCGFFGPSSNVAFMRHVSRAVARVYNVNASPASQPTLQMDGHLMTASRSSSPRRLLSPGSMDAAVNYYAVPPRAETLALVRRYFSNTGVLFPFLHEETFLETYEVMERNNFQGVRRTWLGLLNMVLALARSTAVDMDSDAEKRMLQSETYYQRARGLCGKQMMRGTSLEVVQYLLLMGQYLQGTQRSVQAWTTIGLAVRTAFQLGLHSIEASYGVPALEREVRIRTFYGCVILDRQQSMTYGRPPAIPDQYIKLLLPKDYPNITRSASDPDLWKQLSVPFYNATIHLYMLMWKTIDLCYGGNLGCEKAPGVLATIPQIFPLEQELLDWERALPIDLKLRQPYDLPPEGTDEDLYRLERFRVILALRYNNIRVLLHRPILVKFLDACGHSKLEGQEGALLLQLGHTSLCTCIQASMDIISVVNSVVHSTGLRRRILGSYWSSLYYTFNAALVLFTACLVYNDATIHLGSHSIPFERIRESIDGATAALRHLDRGNKMVNRCREYLERLAQLLDIQASTNTVPQFNTLPSAGNFALDQPVLDNNIPSSMMTNHSPFGLEFAEFMTNGDLEFLNNLPVPETMDTRFPRGHHQTPF